ncbi:MAG: hypothetical protein HY537_11920 [Deltaproteobacteria bacterium]|nr:hypothetical protein [Deltaproteobacteria bacterium]
MPASWLLSGFLFLCSICRAADSVEVRRITLPLGEQTTVGVDDSEIISAHSTSDRQLRLTKQNNMAVLQALDFGDVTVTLFSGSGKVSVFRVTIPGKPAELPRSFLQEPKYWSGSHGTIGTRVGFRSVHGIFENLALQEEYFSFRSAPGEFSHDVKLRTAKPIYYDDPKATRFIDTVAYSFEQRKKMHIRVGDTDPLLSGEKSTGNLRGLRVDLHKDRVHPYGFVGIAHSGVENFILGSRYSAVGGAGSEFKLLPNLVLQGHAIGFEKNPSLQLPQAGLEGKLGASWSAGWIEQLAAEWIFDRDLASHLNTSAVIDLDPVAFSIAAGHSQAQSKVFTPANRFGGTYDSYSIAARWAPQKMGFRLGGSLSRSLNFVTQDEVPGRAELTGGSVEFAFEPLKGWTNELYANTYTTNFTPFSEVPGSREGGERFENRIEVALSEKDHATVSADFSSIQSSRLGVDYEDRHLLLGWKRLLFPEARDYFQLEGGLTHFRFPSNPQADGYYFLTRLSSRVQGSWIQWDGLIQNELKAGSSTTNTLRMQLSALLSPSPAHDLSIAFYHNFDWFRDVLADSRGLYFAYTFHFGSAVRSVGLLSALRRYAIHGTVRLEQGKEKTPIPNAKVELSGDDGYKALKLTNEKGEFLFPALKKGSYFLSIVRSDLNVAGRLATASPMRLEISDRDIETGFLFSENAEISGIVFNDINQNKVADPIDPPVLGTSVRYRKRGDSQWHTQPASDGSYQLRGLESGIWELGIDRSTLPAGFRLDVLKEQIVEVTPNSMKTVNFPLGAERSISGIVFKDNNNNKVYDSGDALINGEWVYFGKHKTPTGEGGRFLFRHLPPGHHSVRCRNAKSEAIRLSEGPATVINVQLAVQ